MVLTFEVKERGSDSSGEWCLDYGVRRFSIGRRVAVTFLDQDIQAALSVKAPVYIPTWMRESIEKPATTYDVLDFEPDSVRHILQQIPSYSLQFLHDACIDLSKSQKERARRAETARAADAEAGAEATEAEAEAAGRDALAILMERADEAREKVLREASEGRDTGEPSLNAEGMGGGGGDGDGAGGNGDEEVSNHLKRLMSLLLIEEVQSLHDMKQYDLFAQRAIVMKHKRSGMTTMDIRVPGAAENCPCLRYGSKVHLRLGSCPQEVGPIKEGVEVHAR